MSTHEGHELGRIYERRFKDREDYRRAVWRVLIDGFFQRFVRPTDTVLDLGGGYGEFITQIQCGERYVMDLNPETAHHVGPDVRSLSQDCSDRWDLEDGCLDVVFTSNFFEHLPDKPALGRTLDEAHRCLKPGGRLIAMGPNVKYLPGKYWDFWDHYIPLTESALKEALEIRAFRSEVCLGRFLPYTMASGPRYPLAFLRLYLRLPAAWALWGRQFLVVAQR